MTGVKDRLIQTIGKRLTEVSHKRQPYIGMMADISLVGGYIYPQDSGQNVDAIHPEDSSEGLPEDALSRLIKYNGERRTRQLLVKSFGNRDVDPIILDQKTQEGVMNLKNSPRYPKLK